MPDSETEVPTLLKLALISERAQREPDCQFTSLAHLLNERFLEHCYHRLGRDRASGVDGVSWHEYGLHLEENLRDLVARLKAKRYTPLPARRVYIPKDEHSMRPLGLPALEDKIVQKAIALILEAIYEADFLDCSYGFRPGRNCHQSLDAVDKTVMRNPINHVIDADIKGFFDTVSHAWMLKFLGVRIVDPSFLLLIERFLKAGYMDSELLVATEQRYAARRQPQPSAFQYFPALCAGPVVHETHSRSRSAGHVFWSAMRTTLYVLVQYQDDALYIVQALAGADHAV